MRPLWGTNRPQLKERLKIIGIIGDLLTASVKNGKKNKPTSVYRLPWKGLFSPIFLQSGVNENNLKDDDDLYLHFFRGGY